MASATSIPPQAAPPPAPPSWWTWPVRLFAMPSSRPEAPPHDSPGFGWTRQFDFNSAKGRYYLLVPFRAIAVFGGFIFAAGMEQALPRAATSVAFLLIWPELLAAHMSLAACNMSAKRAWVIANLALYAAGLLLLIVGVAAPWSPPPPGRLPPTLPGFQPLPKMPDMPGEMVGLLARGPALFALFEAVLAGFTLPAVRMRHWRRDLSGVVDEFPGVDGPALAQPYSDEGESRQAEPAAAHQDRGALADVFAYQNRG